MTDEEMAAEIAELRKEDDAYEERWEKIWSQSGSTPEKPEAS